MGVVAVVGIGLSRSLAGSDFVACTTTEACTEVDTDFGIDWVGTAQADMMLALVQPKRALHFSLSRCQQSFLSRAGILCNIFLRVLLTYKT